LSVGFSQRTGQDDERTLVRRTLSDGLGLQPGARRFSIFRDHVSGLEFIRSNTGLIEHGLYVELDAYKYHVFMDFREVEDNDAGDYANLTAYLDGRGVPSIEESRQEIYLQPVRQPLMALLNAGMLRRLWDGRVLAPGGRVDANLLDDAENAMTHALREICRFSNAPGDEIALAKRTRRELDAALRLPVLGTRLPVLQEETEEAEQDLPGPLAEPGNWGTLLAWWVVHGLGRVAGDDDAERARSWIDEWHLGTLIGSVLRDLGASEMAANDGASLVKLLTSHQQWAGVRTARQAMLSLLRDTEVQQWLQVNRFQDILWFNRETFERLVRWLAVIAVVTAHAESATDDQAAAAVAHALAITEELLAAEGQSGYQIDRLLAALP
jgi:hypothetical protein